MLRQLVPQFDTIVLTQFLTNPRATKIEHLHAMCPEAEAQIVAADTPEEALRRATEITGPDGLVCGTGSIFLAAELRHILQ